MSRTQAVLNATTVVLLAGRGAFCLLFLLLAGLFLQPLCGAEPPARTPRFIRGDVDMNFSLDLGDVFYILGYLYFDEPKRLDCEAAADWNSDEQVNLGDVLSTIFYLFANGLPPNEPYPRCGEDPSPAGLPCESYWVCGTGRFSNSFDMHLTPVSAGEFVMGSPVDERGRYDDEVPHLVTLTCDFYMTATEITQAQYLAVMDENPSVFTQGEFKTMPVDGVGWHDAAEFCQRLSLIDGRRYRLPYEAEWEYACRAGTTTRFSFGDILDCSDDACLCPQASPFMWNQCSDGNIAFWAPVGLKQPNPWGFYDMHGHLCEWCQDWYGPYPKGPVINPTGPPIGTYKITRGWDNLSPISGPRFREVRSARRFRNEITTKGGGFGFRVVLELPSCSYND